MTKDDFESILSNITLPFPTWKLLLRYDGERPYLQIEEKDGTDNVTGEPMSWRGRKWMLSRYMCVSEVVRTAHKAVMAASEHEINERFHYKGVAIFDPHLNVDILVETKDLQYRLDTRDFRTGLMPKRKSNG